MSNIVTFEYIIRPRSTSVSPGSTVEKKYQYLNSLSKNNTNNFTFSRNLKIGIKGDDVKKLQIFLNNNGFILVSNGPGSPGNETDRFGSLTKNALKRFQEAFRANILTPAGISSATGYFGPVTRNFLKSGFLPLR
jgi:peptidoglycan hydrolase-like protein with peptidoglycan-binding domain